MSSLGLSVDLRAGRRRSLPHLLTSRGGRQVAFVLPLLGGLVLWLVSLTDIPLAGLGKAGLTPALPLTWFLGAGLLVLTASSLCWRRSGAGWLSAAYIAAVVVVLYATVPALTSVPHYAWVYKHIGVTRFIGANHGVDPGVDIYNRWPGFFTLAAAFSSWVHMDPLRFAAWAEPVFALLETLLVGAVGYGVSRSRRVAAFSALIFSLGNWIGQAYFAPQSAAYLLALGLLLVFLRAFASEPPRQWINRLLERVTRRAQPERTLGVALPWGPGVSVALVLLIDAAIVASHQLTPYVLLMELGALTVFGATRSWALIAVMAVLTLGYLMPNLGYISRNFGLFTTFNPATNVSHPDWAVAHLSFLQANAGGLVSVLLIGLMSVSALLMARRGDGRRALALMVMAVAPVEVLFGQNYGGEASLRVFLFSSPWRDILIAFGIATLRSHRVRQIAAAAVCLGVVSLFVPAFFGAEELNIIPPGEVSASDYFFARAPAGSVLMLIAPDFPTRAGARYGVMRGPSADDGPNVLGVVSFQDRQLGRADVPHVISEIHQYSRSGFLVFSTTGYRYAELHAWTPPGAVAHLEAAVAASPQFRLWYRNRDARIYRLVSA